MSRSAQHRDGRRVPPRDSLRRSIIESALERSATDPDPRVRFEALALLGHIADMVPLTQGDLDEWETDDDDDQSGGRQ